MAKFSKTRAVLGFGLALSVVFAAPAQIAAQQSEIVFLPDAHSTASRWVASHPTEIAVVIRVGTATTLPPERISYWLGRDFTGAGCKAHFLFERGGNGGSSVGFLTRNHGWGPYSLAKSRSNVAEACAQHRFEIARGLH